MESSSTLKASDSRRSFGTTLHYRLDLNYIGSDFYGWQSQPHAKTVQDTLEKALSTVLRRPIRITGASRTDTGVHAEHQVAIFRCEHPLDCRKVQRSIQALVPPSIGILGLSETERDFHPIRDAEAKLYRYRIWTGRGLNAFLRPFSWHLPTTALDKDRMRDASSLFLGRHNFQAFAATDTSAKTFERQIFDIQWRESEAHLLEFYILGEGFLKQMVRNLVGTLVEIGQGKRDKDALPAMIASRDRRMVGRTAPALGLSLVEIFYQPITVIPATFLPRDMN